MKKLILIKLLLLTFSTTTYAALGADSTSCEAGFDDETREATVRGNEGDATGAAATGTQTT